MKGGGGVRESNNLPEKPGPFLPTGEEEDQTENCTLEMGERGAVPTSKFSARREEQACGAAITSPRQNCWLPGVSEESVALQVRPARSTDTGVPPST